jgi:hypothetical protein
LLLSVLRSRLLLLLLEKSKKGATGNLDNLETNPGNITDGVTTSTETRKEDLVVLINEVQATVIGDESGNLLSVLNQLNSNTLTSGRVGLLGTNTHSLNNNALGVGSTHERLNESSSVVGLLVVLIGPLGFSSAIAQLTGCSQTSWLSRSHEIETKKIKIYRFHNI